MGDMTALRQAMIDGQIRPNRVGDARLIAAIAAVPRERFVPKALRGIAYLDEDLEVAPGRFLMEPMVFARLLEAAEVEADDVVLDIGGVTGYSAAVLANLASAVIALENDEKLVDQANETLSALQLGNAAAVTGELQEGYIKEAPYDVIFINGAVDFIPEALAQQLKDGGRIVGVLKRDGIGRGIVATRSQGVLGIRELMDANVCDVPGFQGSKSFKF